ncbi:hypothetical protein ACFL6U_07500 [Planctomycetota bacterium]
MRKLHVQMAVTLLLIIHASVGLSAPPAPYFGQASPGITPKVFAPDVISLTSRYEQNIAFSPDGLECYFAVRTAN